MGDAATSGFVGAIPEDELKNRVSRDPAVVAQTLSRRLPYAVNMHGAMTSRFVGFVARWVRDGLEPRHQ